MTVILIIVSILTVEDEVLKSWICTALMRVGTRMAVGFDQHFAPFGVTQAQFRVLLAVQGQGGETGIAPSHLADHLLIERATVSVLSTGLVARGWLERQPGPSRRTHLLRLTPAGQDLLGVLVPRAVALADLTLGNTTAAQLAEIQALLQMTETRLRTIPKELQE